MPMKGSGSASGDDDQWTIDIEEKTEPAPECCIYKVPKRLRKINEEAYTPQLISIGPFHHQLPDKQKQKERYREAFVKRLITKEDFDKLEVLVKKKEQRIRDCYSEEFNFSNPDQFIRIILYDAVFIIELFLRNYHRNQYKSDFLLHQQWLTNAIWMDLQLLENQLPYFVLKKLYVSAFGSQPTEELPTFLSLSCKFFGYEEKSAENLDEKKLKHFLDLRRYAMMGFQSSPKLSGEYSGETAKEGTIESLPSAVSLNESGVIFKKTPNSSDCLLNIKFKKGTRCIPFFCKNELRIPRITIEDSTECLIRNLMALEQCHYPSDTRICSYIDLIDSLIDTSKDVDLLVESGIISNRVGDHASISGMFNKLCLQITRSNSYYSDIISDLKSHHRRWWNRTKAALVSVYFRDIWRGTATAAATLLLLLTVLQTMQRLWGGWTPSPK